MVYSNGFVYQLIFCKFYTITKIIKGYFSGIGVILIYMQNLIFIMYIIHKALVSEWFMWHNGYDMQLNACSGGFLIQSIFQNRYYYICVRFFVHFFANLETFQTFQMELIMYCCWSDNCLAMVLMWLSRLPGSELIRHLLDMVFKWMPI